METKKIGISRDLIIHPGETIADLLEDRGISQTELAARTGVSTAYVSNVIAGKKDISAKFAMALEYALDIPKSFWINLQANYDAELLEANEADTITDKEIEVRKSLGEVVKYLRQRRLMPLGEKTEKSILSLRKALQISNISNLGNTAICGAFRMAENRTVNPYVLGAWVRLCQISGEKTSVENSFSPDSMDRLIAELKDIMVSGTEDLQKVLTDTMSRYGIDFSIVRNFRGAPVQGYIALKADGTYQICMTIRGAYADIFWFSLFHELGHIANGDISRSNRFLDDGTDIEKEHKADNFAGQKLMDSKAYAKFLQKANFSLLEISNFAKTQGVMPYIVIGRLQKEKKLLYSQYSNYKDRYKWVKSC